VTRGQLPQRAGVARPDGGGAAAAVPPSLLTGAKHPKPNLHVITIKNNTINLANHARKLLT